VLKKSLSNKYRISNDNKRQAKEVLKGCKVEKISRKIPSNPIYEYGENMKNILLVLCVVLFSCATSHNFGPEYDALKYPESSDEISKEFSVPETFKNFKKEICEKMNDEQCIKEYGKTVWARFVEKYNYADENEIIKLCTAHPIECKQPEYIEGAFVVSHNSNVEIEKNKAQAIENRRAKRKTAAIWSAFSAGMEAQQKQELQRQISSPVTTDCYSDKWGHTQCTSR
jgi:hypothetical protein